LPLGFPKVGVGSVQSRAPSDTPVETSPSSETPGHLARELHDLVAQPLIGLVLEIHELRSRHSGDAENDLARLEDATRRVLRNTRELLVDLRGQGEIRLNFPEVLRNELIRRSFDRLAQPPALQVSSTWPQHINGWVAFNLLRIVQEAVANAARHGRATRIDIILSTGPAGEAVIVVLDDGIGLGEALPGLGMVGMQERAVILGGRFTAGPRETGGTRAEVRVPLRRLE